jgi:AcrR family transcriptional regulator
MGRDFLFPLFTNRTWGDILAAFPTDQSVGNECMKEVIMLDMNPPVEAHGTKDKEAAILQAALKAYASYGMAEATTRQIAGIAGIGKSTIYEYYKSKEELQSAAFRYLMEGTLKGHRQMHQLAERDPASALVHYVDSAIETALNEPATLLLISQYSLGSLLKADRFETIKEQYEQKMYDVMKDLTDEFRFIIQMGMEKKVFHPQADMPVDGLAYTVCALIREIQAQAFLQSRPELIQTCSVIKEMVIKLLGIDGAKHE